MQEAVEVVHGHLHGRSVSSNTVRAILLDPSCSGSGIATERLDYLLPSHSSSRDDQDGASTSSRVTKLSAFQKKALSHALSFPSVERVVYSTCSIHQAENEDVVNAVLPLATSLGFELATPFPEWHRRGLPVFEGSEHLLRTDPEDGLEGFFISLFVRKAVGSDAEEPNGDVAVDPLASFQLFFMTIGFIFLTMEIESQLTHTHSVSENAMEYSGTRSAYHFIHVANQTIQPRTNRTHYKAEHGRRNTLLLRYYTKQSKDITASHPHYSLTIQLMI